MSNTTTIIFTSPRPIHPSPAILDETIASIRQSNSSPIIICCDGPSPETNREALVRYQGFKEVIRGRYDNTRILEFESWSQQSGMLERALSVVSTPLVFMCEDDWNVSPNVEWERLGNIILGGRLNVIRLYAYCRIIPCHMGMMTEHTQIEGVYFWLTMQWSQNPHLASTDFYRKEVLPRCVGQTDAIENVMHGVVACGPWERWRVGIYNPENEGTTQMVRHLDGRRPV